VARDLDEEVEQVGVPALRLLQQHSREAVRHPEALVLVEQAQEELGRRPVAARGNLPEHPLRQLHVKVQALELLQARPPPRRGQLQQLVPRAGVEAVRLVHLEDEDDIRHVLAARGRYKWGAHRDHLFTHL
jgi:hypothetical protein